MRGCGDEEECRLKACLSGGKRVDLAIEVKPPKIRAGP